MTKPIYEYQLKLQSSKAVNLLEGDPLGNSIQVYESYAPSLEATETMLQEGAVMFYVRQKHETHSHCIILAPSITERMPSLHLPTVKQATEIIDKCKDLINQAWSKAKFADRELYEHLIVGLPDKKPAVPI